MHRKLLLSVAVCAFYVEGISQIVKDTATIDEVVITGQFNPQSIKKSLYKVEVITSEDIQRMAVNNVAEVLSQTLNILIKPNSNSGDSKADMMELGAEYTKVLIDNIPVVGDTGLGNNIDLTKIALENIERIEIVKGSMGVEFGNNAIAGVINIITKKSSRKKWNFRGTIQEETVGKEYDWIDYGKGRHIQSLGISHNISDKFFADISFNRNDFQGFWGDKHGKNYFEKDNKRGYNWLPKEQLNPALLLRYSTPKTQLFYKADYLSETVNYYNPVVEDIFFGGGERTYIGNDKDYITKRFLNHFNLQSEIFKKTRLALDFSYQKQTREIEKYVSDIPAVSILSKEEKYKYYQSETFYSRGTINNFINSKNINLQLGYEGDFTKGFAGYESSRFFENGNKQKDVLNASAFAAAEFNLSGNWFLRPGFRINFSDTFETKPNFSLVLKNKINERSEFRAIVGSSNRNPNFEELYTFFVDANHNVQGNENLKPENSYSGTLFYSIYNKPESSLKWGIDLSTMYLQIEDQIQMVQLDVSTYKFYNVETFESWVNAVSGRISNKNFGLTVGFSIIGRALALQNLEDEKYRYTNEVNASAYYNLLKTNTSFALFFKGRGSSYSIFEDKSLGITQYLLAKRKPFSLMDFSISQKIWKNHFTITAGVRNIFDIGNNLAANTDTQGAHSTSMQEMLFYGRSYFTRLNFNF